MGAAQSKTRPGVALRAEAMAEHMAAGFAFNARGVHLECEDVVVRTLLCPRSYGTKMKDYVEYKGFMAVQVSLGSTLHRTEKPILSSFFRKLH